MPKSKRALLCPFTYTNVRPEDYNTHTNNKGDCTTRAMTYALKGELSYKQIEAMQYLFARQYHTVRNENGVWDKVLTNNPRSWKWIQLGEEVTRGELGLMLKEESQTFAILCQSSGHIACIHNGQTIDTWDSRGGRCYGILVHPLAVEMVLFRLHNYNISAEITTLPTRVVKRTYRRRWRYWG